MSIVFQSNNLLYAGGYDNKIVRWDIESKKITPLYLSGYYKYSIILLQAYDLVFEPNKK